MNFSVLTREEAVSKFRKADNKSAAIQLIADLTASKKVEVAEFLGVKLIKKYPYVAEK